LCSSSSALISVIGIPLHTVIYDDGVDLPAPQLVSGGNLLVQCFRMLCSICAPKKLEFSSDSTQLSTLEENEDLIRTAVNSSV